MSANGGPARPRRWVLAATGVGAVVVLVGAILLLRTEGFAATARNVPTFTVQRGPLTISVLESGTIKPQDQVVLKNEVEGQVTLIFLIPEGTKVQAGDLLAELDASRLQDDLVAQKIALENADADFVRARENLEVVRNQAASDISKAELDFQFAQEDARKYEEGDYPQQLRDARSKITIAEAEMNRAREKLDWSKRLFEEKYLSQIELEADTLDYQRATLDYELAKAAEALLQEFTYHRQKAQLESDIEQARMALDRVKLKANSDVVQAQADLKAKDAQLQQQKNKLAKIEDQIAKTRIVAPRDGLVVYATSANTGGRRGMTQPLEEGQTVRERQELIYLPSTSAMMAELMVHESSLEKVQVGQPVHVTVDAMPGRVFTGQVTSIAPLPDAQSTWMNPDLKVYLTKVFLDGANVDLRTGMSCRAEIIIDQLADAIYVPTQAVVRVGGKPTVFVRDPRDQFVPRVVDVGLDNSSMVHIKGGIALGEVVSLTPPLAAGAVARNAADAQASQPALPAPERSRNARAAPSDSQPAQEDRATRRGRPGRGGEEDLARPGGDGRREFDPDRAAEWRRRFEQMTPEQREEALRRMRERGFNGDAAGGRPDRQRGDRPAGDRPTGDRPEGGPPAGEPESRPAQPGDEPNP